MQRTHTSVAWFGGVALTLVWTTAGCAPTSENARVPVPAPVAAVSPPSPQPPRELVVPAGPPALVSKGASLFGTDVVRLPTGAFLTQDAVPGAHLFELDPHLLGARAFRAGGAVASAVSPDGRTLLVLTSGYNRVFDPDTGATVRDASTEWVFVYDLGTGIPRETQALPVPNAFGGIAFHPSGTSFYVGGGSDDVVHAFARDAAGHWAQAGAPVSLGHSTGESPGGLGIDESPYAAGVALSASGQVLVVANHENDSVSLVDTRSWTLLGEVNLVPGGGVAGGEFPASVLVLGENRALVAAQRDREVVEIDLAARKVVRRVRVGGQPTKLLANRAQTKLYVANANTDSVSVIDLGTGRVEADIPTAAPRGSPALALRGSNPNALALSPDESRLYVTNGGNSTLAVVDLAARAVVGLVPTGFYPTAVATSTDGAHLYVVHAKSPSGANPLGPWTLPARQHQRPYSPGAGNQYSLQLQHAGLLAFPTPDAATLAKLTRQSIANNRFDADVHPPPVFAALAGKVKHVVYVIGENRTYDQLLGDVAGADGDPKLVLWGEPITPNQHALARTFVTLDRFFDSGGVSGDGWQWTTSGHTTDVAEKAVPVEYAGRGSHSYDWEGGNRNVNVSWATVEERKAANPATPSSIDLLPGTADVGAVDGPDEGGVGFLWDAALARGLDVRNYGVFCDDFRYGERSTNIAPVPPLPDPFAAQVRVAFPTRASLHDRTDPYFRGFDMRFSDVRREAEWEREMDGFEKSGKLPALEIVRLPHDHLGSFDAALDGVSTPDTQMADKDYALGRLVERLSRSKFWEETVVVALEDDAQNGSDHVDAHRSFVFLAGGHVKRHAKISTAYSTPSVLRTIELLLGIGPLGQADAFAPAIDEAFDAHADLTPFAAQVPAVLRTTKLPLPAAVGAVIANPRGDAALWARLTKGQDFSRADALDSEALNRALACGLLGQGCAAALAPED